MKIHPIIVALLALVGALTVKLANANQYDPEIAKESWIYCLASYCPQRSIETWKAAKMSQLYPNITGVRVIYNEAENTLAYLSHNYKDNVINIVFRGTEPWSITNWINNLDVLRKKYVFCEGCEVHSGFYDSYLNLEPEVLKNLEEMRSHYPSAKIRITGHSLGAAFALFAALEIQRSIEDIDAFYSFGLPRVGNEKFAQFANKVFEGKITPRITNGRDPVPHVPLQSMGFEHPDTEIFYEDAENGKYRVCQTGGEDETCSNNYFLALNVNAHFDYMGFNYLSYVIKDCYLE